MLNAYDIKPVDLVALPSDARARTVTGGFLGWWWQITGGLDCPQAPILSAVGPNNGGVYRYVIVPTNGTGTGFASPPSEIRSAPAPLTANAYIEIQMPVISGVTSWSIYRIHTMSDSGLIGSGSPGATFLDQGFAADGTNPPCLPNRLQPALVVG